MVPLRVIRVDLCGRMLLLVFSICLALLADIDYFSMLQLFSSFWLLCFWKLEFGVVYWQTGSQPYLQCRITTAMNVPSYPAIRPSETFIN